MEAYITYMTGHYGEDSYYIQKKAAYSARFLAILTTFSLATFLLFIEDGNQMSEGVIGALFLLIAITALRAGRLALAQNGMIGLLFADAMIHLNNIEMFHYYGLLVVMLFSSAIICTKLYQRFLVYGGILWGVSMRLLLTQSRDFITVRGIDMAREHVFVAVSMVALIFLSYYLDTIVEKGLHERALLRNHQPLVKGNDPRRWQIRNLPTAYQDKPFYTQKKAQHILVLLSFVYLYSLSMFVTDWILTKRSGFILVEIIGMTLAMALVYFLWARGKMALSIFITGLYGVVFVSMIFFEPFHIRFYMQLMMVLLVVFLGFTNSYQYYVTTAILLPICLARVWIDSEFLLRNFATVVMTILVIGTLLYYIKRIFDWEIEAAEKLQKHIDN